MKSKKNSKAKVSKNLKHCLSELKMVSTIKNSKARSVILNELSKKSCIYEALREIAVNIISKNSPILKRLNSKEISKLRMHQKVIKALANGSLIDKQRSKFVLQSGGFLPLILPIVSTLAGIGVDKLIDYVSM